MMAIRSATIFAALFAVAYVVCVEMNWAAFTYHPRPGTWSWGAAPGTDGPAMYWYGWIALAALASGAATLVALPVTRRVAAPLWIGWAVPLGAMLSFLWFLRIFFFR